MGPWFYCFLLIISSFWFPYLVCVWRTLTLWVLLILVRAEGLWHTIDRPNTVTIAVDTRTLSLTLPRLHVQSKRHTFSYANHANQTSTLRCLAFSYFLDDFAKTSRAGLTTLIAGVICLCKHTHTHWPHIEDNFTSWQQPPLTRDADINKIWFHTFTPRPSLCRYSVNGRLIMPHFILGIRQLLCTQQVSTWNYLFG